MDLDVPGALPTMLCRPPTINGSAQSVRNLAAVQAMPGITDVAIIPHTSFVAGGVAVRGKTFGQCIDAIDALDVVWGPGTADGKSDDDVLSDLHKAELPLTPAVPLTKVLDQTFTFYFRPGDPLETNCAVADVKAGSAEVWSSLGRRSGHRSSSRRSSACRYRASRSTSPRAAARSDATCSATPRSRRRRSRRSWASR